MARNLVVNVEVVPHKREFIANSIPQTSPELIAAGPLFKQPGTMPYRHVIHAYGHGSKVGEFVVYRELFYLKEGGGYHTHFEHGHYYSFRRQSGPSHADDSEAAAFAKALGVFAKCCARDAEFAESLNRRDVLMSDGELAELKESQAASDLQL